MLDLTNDFFIDNLWFPWKMKVNNFQYDYRFVFENHDLWYVNSSFKFILHTYIHWIEKKAILYSCCWLANMHVSAINQMLIGVFTLFKYYVFIEVLHFPNIFTFMETPFFLSSNNSLIYSLTQNIWVDFE